MRGSFLLTSFLLPFWLVIFVRADRGDMRHQAPGAPSPFKDTYRGALMLLGGKGIQCFTNTTSTNNNTSLDFCESLSLAKDISTRYLF